MADLQAAAAGRAAPGGGFTARVATDVMSIARRPLGEPVLERTRHAVLDWLGVTIYGAANDSSLIAQQFALTEGGNQVSRILGTELKVTPRQAALANGIAAHSSDFDDMGLGCHPSTVVLPAAFAVAEAVEADGETTVEAILQGYEAVKLIYAAVGRAQYDRGFHSTGTLGVFGAAAAAGRLLGLDLLRLQRAFGIAATQAAGLKASFGTMSKHMNAGNAAAAGILSAYLARGGFTGATDVIEASQGFARGHGNDLTEFNPDASDSFTGQRLGVEQVMFKPYSACAGTHSAIAGVQALKAEHRFTAGDVESVEVILAAEMDQVCNIPEPATGSEGMFSVRYTAALALAGSSLTPASFTAAKVEDLAIARLRDRITVIPQDGIPVNASPVTIRLKNGRVLTTTTQSYGAVSDQGLPQQRARLEGKYRDLVVPQLGPDRTKRLLDTVGRIESLDSIRELTDLTTARQ
jgi:2-methylcitrate dehydratase PrpD